jgi:hypothetical protein
MGLAQGLRSALFFFFVLFLLRVLLRNEWVAAAAWVLLFASLFVLGSGNTALNWTVNLVVFTAEAIVVLRWGLLAIATSFFVNIVVGRAPVAGNASAWFFGNALFMCLTVAAIAAWATYVAIAGRKLWKQDLFE